MARRGRGLSATCPSDLDAWLADPQVTSRHRRTSAAPAADLWRAAAASSASTRRARWAASCAGASPDTPADLRFADLFARYPFAVLDEGARWSISGLCGPIWTSARDYARIDGRTFREWTRPGTVRVLFGHWVEEDDDGQRAGQRGARRADRPLRRLRLRALWLLVRRFERVIGSEPLPLAVARAEARHAMSHASGTITYSRKNSFHTNM